MGQEFLFMCLYLIFTIKILLVKNLDLENFGELSKLQR